MKKIITIIVILIAVISLGIYFLLKEENRSNNDLNPSDNQNNEMTDNGDKNIENKNENTSKKILVVYYSATGSTARVAKEIANNLNADVFEIVPEKIYTSDDLNWSNNNSRVTKEHNDESLRDVKLKTTTVDNFDSYDTILIGYPIWWGVAAWPVNNFVKDNDFTGKTVIPFCTSASSSLGNSDKLLEELAGTGNWKSGHRFSSSATDTDIKSFTDSIK